MNLEFLPLHIELLLPVNRFLQPSSNFLEPSICPAIWLVILASSVILTAPPSWPLPLVPSIKMTPCWAQQCCLMACLSSYSTEGNGAWGRTASFPVLAMLSHLGPKAGVAWFHTLPKSSMNTKKVPTFFLLSGSAIVLFLPLSLSLSVPYPQFHLFF